MFILFCIIFCGRAYFSDFPTSFANCSNSGCFGKIMETPTGKTEHLRFFCEEYNDDYWEICMEKFMAKRHK